MFVKQLFKGDTREGMLTHAALGIAGEAGELVDAIKKHVIYGKPLDLANVREEIGDLRFYLEALCNVLDLNDQTIIQENINKLAKRYKDLTYSSSAAIERADKL
jgi:NTP pyrophosphatase (non-canonical NTP hydrolase)